MILRLSLYVDTKAKIDPEILKEILENQLTSLLSDPSNFKGIESFLYNFLKEEGYEKELPARNLVKPTKSIRKKFLKFLTKEEVIEQMRKGK